MEIASRNEEIQFSDLQNALVSCAVEGKLSNIVEMLVGRDPEEFNHLLTLMLSKLLNLSRDEITENHYLILQMIVSVSSRIDSTIVNSVGYWLIHHKDNDYSVHGQRILNVLAQRGFIIACELSQLQNAAQIIPATVNNAPHQSLSCEMSLAIFTNNAEEFLAKFIDDDMKIGVEQYLEIITSCLQARAIDIVALLLQDYPIHVQNEQPIKECIKLIYGHLYPDHASVYHQEELAYINGMKVLLLQYISSVNAIAQRKGSLRTDLSGIVKNIMVQEKKLTNGHDIEAQIDTLIRSIKTDQEDELAPVIQHNSRSADLFKRLRFIGSYLYNVFQTRPGGQFQRRSFITDYLMLGMMPGVKCGEAIIAQFSDRDYPLGLVVTCLEGFEIGAQDLIMHTAARPEYWRNKPGKIQQIIIELEDFGFKGDPTDVIKALNAMRQAELNHRGTYIHCKAGKGRSAFVTALDLLLFHFEEFRQATLLATVQAIYQFMAKSRPQVCNNQKSWNGVCDFLPSYLNSVLRLPEVPKALDLLANNNITKTITTDYDDFDGATYYF